MGSPKAPRTLRHYGIEGHWICPPLCRETSFFTVWPPKSKGDRPIMAPSDMLLFGREIPWTPRYHIAVMFRGYQGGRYSGCREVLGGIKRLRVGEITLFKFWVLFGNQKVWVLSTLVLQFPQLEFPATNIDPLLEEVSRKNVSCINSDSSTTNLRRIRVKCI